MGKTVEGVEGLIAYRRVLPLVLEQAVRDRRRYAVSAERRGRCTTINTVGALHLITPWSFPMAMGTLKTSGPAIAAGCTMVMSGGLYALSDAARGSDPEEAGCRSACETVNHVVLVGLMSWPR